MTNFWDEDATSEYDLLQEEAWETEELAEQHANEPVVIEPDDDEIDALVEESAFDLDVEESKIVYNARIRLEQAKLYELLINHNLFDGVEADPRAIEVVQNELKHYVVKRLQILMGMRQPKPRQIVEHVGESPFNDTEVEFLKALAWKGTRGRSASETQESTPASVKPQGLKPIANKTAQPARLKKPAQQSRPEPLPQKSSRKPKRTSEVAKPKPEKISTKNKTAEEIALEEIKQSAGKKPFHKMSQKEKAEEIRRVNEKHAKNTKRPDGALPIPDANTLEMQYMTQQANRASSSKGLDAIMNIVAQKHVTGQIDKK